MTEPSSPVLVYRWKVQKISNNLVQSRTFYDLCTASTIHCQNTLLKFCHMKRDSVASLVHNIYHFKKVTWNYPVFLSHILNIINSSKYNIINTSVYVLTSEWKKLLRTNKRLISSYINQPKVWAYEQLILIDLCNLFGNSVYYCYQVLHYIIHHIYISYHISYSAMKHISSVGYHCDCEIITVCNFPSYFMR